MKIMMSKSILIMVLFLSVYMYGQDNIERAALIDIYNATGGPNWDENKNWGDANIPIDEWYGVTVVNGHVTRLFLSDNALTSSLPESIGNLEYLQSLDLINNAITSLPESIGNLENLVSLSLSNNRLSLLPESIGNLENLVSLGLGRNQLTSLPESIGNLVGLKYLYLYQNELTSLSENIGNLESLEDLHLIRNKLTSLPESIVNLENLNRLYLEHNYLEFDDLEPIYDIPNTLFYTPQRRLSGIIDQIVSIGDHVTLNSGFSNSENTNFQWYKMNFSGTSLVGIAGATNNTYVIENFVFNDTNFYVCIATNTVLTELTLSQTIVVRIMNGGIAQNRLANLPQNLLILENQISLTKVASVLMSPNPVNVGNNVAIKNIKGNKVHIEVINTAFKTFKSETVALKNNTYTLNTAGLSVGMYIVKITNTENNTSIAKRLIIK